MRNSMSTNHIISHRPKARPLDFVVWPITYPILVEWHYACVLSVAYIRLILGHCKVSPLHLDKKPRRFN